MKKNHVGCSGWQYSGWIGEFYPQRKPAVPQLEYYTSKLGSVEVNASFYNLPKPEWCENWFRRTPENFTFTMKGPRVITHRRRINESEVVGDYLEKFTRACERLEHKLAAVLWQFPPNFHATKINADRLSEFMDKLHNQLPDSAFEFRHRSWRESTDLRVIDEINSRGFCVVRHDHAQIHDQHRGQWFGANVHGQRFSYTRLHGPNGDCRGRYDEPSLQLFSEFSKTEKNLFYFNNDIDVGAPYDAMRLQEILSREET